MKIFTRGEEITYKLDELYEKHGYRRFKMNKFEEYAFYIEHKNFLKSENVISFGDLDGKLMALKPDITLSIAKNADTEKASRVYYNENVYRSANGMREYKEIPQVGLEFIGDIDIYAECETILLAARSMAMLGGRYTLDLSHMGFVGAMLSSHKLSEKTHAAVLEALGQKDGGEIYRLCVDDGSDEDSARRVASLAEIQGSFIGAYEKARALCTCEQAEKALDELATVYNFLKSADAADCVNLDLSIVNDMNYYNGIVFQGYLENVPRNVLSGGRYDNLLLKLGKSGGACGFSVYIDLIELYRSSVAPHTCDVALIYGDGDDICAVEKLADSYRASGNSVVVTKNECDVSAAKKIKFIGTGAEK